jgi:hypothetical protein
VRLLPLLLVGACAAGPSDLTTIDDLRLVAAIADPPEVAAGSRSR